MFNSPLTARMAGFLQEIGLRVVTGEITEPSFLPGILIHKGGLLVDESQLLYPGDLLHEAGHLAMIPAERRAEVNGDLNSDMGEEIGAIAWSYAAALHLGIDPAIVFHPHGYKGSSGAFLENFSEGRFVGVPMLQWKGLALEPKHALEAGLPPYPHMIRWLCD